MNIFEEVIEKCDDKEFRKGTFEKSGIAPALAEIGADSAYFEMESGRKIRNGFMGLVVSISNKLLTKYEMEKDDITVVEYLDAVGETWTSFVEDELKQSNEKNNKTLGKGKDKEEEEEEEDKEGLDEEQMAKIMAGFSTFNSILSPGNSNDDDDDDTDSDDEEEPKVGQTDQGVKVEKVVLKTPDELKNDFVDNNYWKLDTSPKEIDYDALLAELED